MKIIITYGMINAWDHEIKMWAQAGSVRMLFDAEKIAWFQKTYANEISEIQQKQSEFVKKYARFDENKKPLPPTQEESAGFGKDMDEFLNTPIRKRIITPLHDA